MMNELKSIDHAAIRTNQSMVIILSLMAFVFDWPHLAAFTALVMLLGSVLAKTGFGFVYHLLLKPLGLVKPELLLDNPEPHRFAQGFGGTVLLLGAAAAFVGAEGLGWGLVWLVIALAALNLFGGFCMGCAMYYWMARLQVPGFVKAPPEGIVPGMRPKGEAR